MALSENWILAADVGGTKTALALCSGTPQRLEIRHTGRFLNRGFDSLETLVAGFLADVGVTPQIACFGVAGAVIEGACVMPNLDWSLSEGGLSEALGIGRVILINDLEATACGIETLPPASVANLNPSSPWRGGNRALIAAGTGLGQALMLPLDHGWWVVPSEGGHADFAPTGETPIALLRHLAHRFGHVSWERVVSGPGLANIYRFLREEEGLEESAPLLERITAAADPVPIIADLGLTGESVLCERALGIFIAAYGAAAGNLALTGMARGGLYIGGGIAPKLLPRLQDGPFLHAFADKGRFQELLKDIPVRVILDPGTALRGAAAHALAEWGRHG